MEHYEFLYLLHRAHLLRRFIAKAEASGEEFHVADAFSPLESGVMAQAQIRKIHLTDDQPMMILRIRYRPSDSSGNEKARKAASVFFSEKCTAVPDPIDEDGWLERVFYSPDILRPVTLSDLAETSP